MVSSKYQNLYEGLDLTNYSPKEIMNSKKVYDYICEAYEISQKENIPMDELLDEGIFSAILGSAVSSTIGVSIMKAVCKCLGIDEKGTLGNLLTSRMVLGAMGAQLGYKW